MLNLLRGAIKLSCVDFACGGENLLKNLCKYTKLILNKKSLLQNNKLLKMLKFKNYEYKYKKLILNKKKSAAKQQTFNILEFYPFTIINHNDSKLCKDNTI